MAIVGRKVEMVCKKCGSSDVRRNADCAWSFETQEWELVALLDDTSCEHCGCERDLKAVPSDKIKS